MDVIFGTWYNNALHYHMGENSTELWPDNFSLALYPGLGSERTVFWLFCAELFAQNWSSYQSPMCLFWTKLFSVDLSGNDISLSGKEFKWENSTELCLDSFSLQDWKWETGVLAFRVHGGTQKCLRRGYLMRLLSQTHVSVLDTAVDLSGTQC